MPPYYLTPELIVDTIETIEFELDDYSGYGCELRVIYDICTSNLAIDIMYQYYLSDSIEKNIVGDYFLYLECARRIDELYWTNNIFCIDSNDISHQFNNACCNGDIYVTKWIYKRYTKLTSGRMYGIVCGNGHLAMVKWLHKTYIIAPETGKHRNCFDFACVCAKRHLALAKWMHNIHKYTNEDIKICMDTYPMWFGMSLRNYKLVRWMQQTFEL